MNEKYENELFGSNIKTLLHQNHKTQAELAKYLYVSTGTIYAILTGRTQLKLTDALEIAEFLGCSVYDFVRLPNGKEKKQ